MAVEDCPHCAASASGRCLACQLGNDRLRWLADTDPAYRRLVREGFPATSTTAQEPAGRSAGDEAALIAAVRLCPHRGRILPPRDGCGCTELWPCGARRGTLDGGAVARTADCTACVRAGGPPAAIPGE
jgi:hypothetical protein